jgi:hypothetical protein
MLKSPNINPKYLVIAGSIVLILICYQLAFKKTIEAYQSNRILKARLEQSSDLTYQPGYLNRKSKNLDLVLSRYQLDSASLRNNILSQVSKIAETEQVKLSGVPTDDPLLHTGQFIIQRVDFEGSYTGLIKTLNHVESHEVKSIARSLILKNKKTDRENPSDKLVLNLFLETNK